MDISFKTEFCFVYYTLNKYITKPWDLWMDCVCFLIKLSRNYILIFWVNKVITAFIIEMCKSDMISFSPATNRYKMIFRTSKLKITDLQRIYIQIFDYCI